MVTHTAPIQQALAVGAAEWPDASDSERLARLAIKGADVFQAERQKAVVEWHSTVESVSGIFSGVFSSDYLDEIRDGWPE